MPLKDLVSPRETRVVLRNGRALAGFDCGEVWDRAERSGMPKLPRRGGEYEYLDFPGPWRHDERLVQIAMELNELDQNITTRSPNHYAVTFEIAIVKGDHYMLFPDDPCLAGLRQEVVIAKLSACWINIDDSTEKGLAAYCEQIANDNTRDEPNHWGHAREAATAKAWAILNSTC